MPFPATVGRFVPFALCRVAVLAVADPVAGHRHVAPELRLLGLQCYIIEKQKQGVIAVAAR